MLKTLIIDDEPLAHQVLQHHLQDNADITLLGSCYNATQALRVLAQQPVDLLLLDINMPALSGIELLKVLHNRPAVILISAYKEFAIEGFELDVVDYLVKPVSRARLLDAISKVQRRLATQTPIMEPYIVLKVDREKRRFLFNDIELLEAYGNYVKVWQGQQVTLVSSTLKRLLQQLPAQQFVQVHKSYVVNKNKIIAQDSDQLRLAGGQPVKVGKLYKLGLAGLLSQPGD
ncbi:MAG: LytTR family DNA-binding domain-containing protein [Gammaproteobacteria bacterium]|nr:LytTR family DNA-binding domain-containing protein [Gammaproteobacteria bacterium]MBU1556193.1 LytTR family DNA-binding domain-containing protein [Gammaproteobacteria bacterium]MBU2071514.1 LytTR family DNA-binding domain-containing protein [Gammaproteobacteria bacterium]MBU2184005.1 LytTR family DNA-binding domain-containing protein [Gammaproteobacteria bacterium]MBU2206909.1 LytTR family DNA-binding domain-containing protein [Gammaproteobacteria bacterium]